MKKIIGLFLVSVLMFIPIASLSADHVISAGESGNQATVVTDSAVMGVTVGPPSHVISTVSSIASRADGTLLWVLSSCGESATETVYYTLDGSSWTSPAFTISLGEENSVSSASAATANEESWPSMSFDAYSAAMYAEGEDRIQSRLGPSKDYCGGGAYKPYKTTSLYALFSENGYVFVDMDYSTVWHRRLYFPISKVYNLESSMQSKQWRGYAATTTVDITPSFGPGFDYDLFDSAPLAAGNHVTVFFEENGYVFAEFNTTVSDTKSTREETIRCYLPADKVQAR